MLVSTARMEDETVARHVLRHELGHMFGAPSVARINTEESLGLHCTNDPCTMQQKLSVAEALKHAYKIDGNKPYCPQCTKDITEYVAP